MSSSENVFPWKQVVQFCFSPVGFALIRIKWFIYLFITQSEWGVTCCFCNLSFPFLVSNESNNTRHNGGQWSAWLPRETGQPLLLWNISYILDVFAPIHSATVAQSSVLLYLQNRASVQESNLSYRSLWADHEGSSCLRRLQALAILFGVSELIIQSDGCQIRHRDLYCEAEPLTQVYSRPIQLLSILSVTKVSRNLGNPPTL